MKNESYWKAQELMNIMSDLEGSANSIEKSIEKGLTDLSINKRTGFESVGMFCSFSPYPIIEKHLQNAAKELKKIKAAKQKEFDNLK